jgi:hypothetical protein
MNEEFRHHYNNDMERIAEEMAEQVRKSCYNTKRMGWTHIHLEIHAYGEYKTTLYEGDIITNLPRDKFAGLYKAVRTEVKLTQGLSGQELAAVTINVMVERNYIRKPNYKDTYKIEN